MTSKRERALERFWDSVNDRDLDRAFDVYQDDAKIALNGRDLPGVNGLKAQLQTFIAAFPDIRFRTSGRWSFGNVLFEEWDATGTHLGDFLGSPPTNVTVRLAAMTIYVFVDDKVTVDRTYADMSGVLRATGVVQATRRS